MTFRAAAGQGQERRGCAERRRAQALVQQRHDAGRAEPSRCRHFREVWLGDVVLLALTGERSRSATRVEPAPPPARSAKQSGANKAAPLETATATTAAAAAAASTIATTTTTTSPTTTTTTTTAAAASAPTSTGASKIPSASRPLATKSASDINKQTKVDAHKAAAAAAAATATSGGKLGAATTGAARFALESSTTTNAPPDAAVSRKRVDDRSTTPPPPPAATRRQEDAAGARRQAAQLLAQEGAPHRLGGVVLDADVRPALRLLTALAHCACSCARQKLAVQPREGRRDRHL